MSPAPLPSIHSHEYKLYLFPYCINTRILAPGANSDPFKCSCPRQQTPGKESDSPIPHHSRLRPAGCEPVGLSHTVTNFSRRITGSSTLLMSETVDGQILSIFLAHQSAAHVK